MIAAPLSLALAGSLLAGPSPDDAPITAGQLHVEVTECGALDAGEVERLLRIELLVVTQEIRSGPPLEVALRCAAPTMSIAVADPLTGKRLSRDVPLPPEEPGRERVVALAIAQLFAASWLELLLPSPPVEPELAPTPVPSAKAEPRAVEAARVLVRERVEKRPRSIAVAFGGIVRGRALEAEPVLMGGGELDLRGWFGNAAIVLRLGAEAGSARRAQGSVRALVLLASLGAAGRLRLAPRWDLGGVVLVGGGVGRLRGDPSQPGVPTGTATAFTGALVAGAGPRLRLGRVALELDAELGGMLRAPQGIVASGRAVTPGGLFAGAALRVAIETPIARASSRTR